MTEDSILRAIVEEEDKYNISEIRLDQLNSVLFSPAEGGISSEFSVEDPHYGIDIALPENSPIYSVSAGRVIFSEWTALNELIPLRDDRRLKNQKIEEIQRDLITAQTELGKTRSQNELLTPFAAKNIELHSK